VRVTNRCFCCAFVLARVRARAHTHTHTHTRARRAHTHTHAHTAPRLNNTLPGTVITSADGTTWTPQASWTCDSGICDVSGVSNTLVNSFGSAALTVSFDPDQDVQFVGITLGNANTYISEFTLSPQSTIQCSGGATASACGADATAGNVCAAENSVCSCDGFVTYGMGSTYVLSHPLSCVATRFFLA
jgi:hypothetical protein